MKRSAPLKQKTPLKRGAPLKAKAPMMRATPMPPPRASMKARKTGKKPPKTLYRNPALLALAKGQLCLIQVPGICLGGRKDTTVACHSNWGRDGKGGNIKAHDWAIAFGCSACHFFIDQSRAPKDVKQGYFYPAMKLTRLAIMSMGKWPDEAERGFQLLYGEAA
ncbi:nuclease domain-containing protein [Achromobacter spanius]|uniref:nuclease domain-containing protein n=1 Tax=Achromobacter spanius TaxID=217203 RepID=UPI003A8FFCB0